MYKDGPHTERVEYNDTFYLFKQALVSAIICQLQLETVIQKQTLMLCYVGEGHNCSWLLFFYHTT